MGHYIGFVMSIDEGVGRSAGSSLESSNETSVPFVYVLNEVVSRINGSGQRPF